MVRYWEKIPPLGWWLAMGLLWLMTAGAAFASQGGKVLRIGSSQSNIAVSHPDGSNWQMRDRVCVIQLRSPIACGRVVKATSKGAIIKLDAPSADVIAGDTIVAESLATGAAPTLAPTTPSNRAARSDANGVPELQQRPSETQARKPSQITPPKAQLLDSVKKHSESNAFNFNLSAGTSISFSFFYPVLNFQFAVDPQWAIGIVPMALFAGNTTASMTGFGGYATVNYYSQGHFRGLWVQAGAGTVYFSVSGSLVQESGNALAAISTVGWRGYWDLGLNIGVGAGLQYIQNPSFSSITVDSAGFLPLVILDVGFNW